MKLSDCNTYTKADIRSMSLGLLVRCIEKARSLYYEKGKSPITDATFDKLEDELERRDPNHPVLSDVGTSSIGAGRKKVKLPYPMYSLNKIKPDKVKAFESWVAHYGGPYVISNKEDGQSLEIIYENKVPVACYTRGDGTVGQDVSRLIPQLNIPKKISTSQRVAIRAETVMPEDKFQKYAREGDKNARNTVAGLVNKLRGDTSLLRHVDVVTYEIIHPRTRPSKSFELLEKMGFTVSPWRKIAKGKLTIELLQKLFVAARKKSKRAIDGIVVESDTVNKRPPAGTKAPPYMFAFKMQDEDDSARVTVRRVDWEETQYGKLQPVIQIKPVQLAGVTVSNISGHNAFFIVNGFRLRERKNNPPQMPIGPGAVLLARRSGDVIPHAEKVLKAARKPDMPGVPFHWDANGVGIIADVKSDLVRDKRITTFFSTVGVDGIKLGVVQKLTAAGFTSVIKILRMKEADVLRIPGFKERSAAKLVQSIKTHTKAVELPTLMDGSGLFGAGMGTRRCALVVEKYPTLLTRWATLSPSQIEKRVIAIPGFQTKTASQFAAGFPKFLKWLRVSKIKPILPKKVKAVGAKLEGQAVCFTGFRNKDLEKSILAQGGTIASGVNKNTTILLYVPGKSSSKFDKAKQLGVETYTVDQFTKKFKL